MKKLLVIGSTVALTTAAVGCIIKKRKRNKIREELAKRDPEELIQLLRDAANVLEFQEMVEMDECMRERFDAAHADLRDKFD